MKRIKEWDCQGCGYRMTATSEVMEKGLAKDDDPQEAEMGELDLCMCLNCGGLYEMRGGEWKRLSDAEIPNGYRRTIKRARRALKRAISVDLTLEQRLRGSVDYE
jgi:hypothetical protein